MTVPIKTRKKLIEVALPLDAINAAAAREKSIRHGHPSTLHLWWARRPLAAARAVIFAQMVDDPSAVPEEFPTEEDQQKERERLFKIIEDLVLWENTTNEEVLDTAREEIKRSWRRACADNADHPQADELFNPEKLPAFHDPFAGGGALPLEAQRLGLESYASDLNPVAVLINKAMIEIPPKFAGRPPVNPESRKNLAYSGEWRGAQGLAEDVRYYGKWIRDEAEKRIGHLYPKVKITKEMVKERPDLKKYEGRELTVIAWLWARTVKSPNPAFAHVDVPLVSNFMLSTRKGREAYVEPIIGQTGYRFVVRVGKPADAKEVQQGTKIGRGANFRCVMSNMPIEPSYVYEEARAGRMGSRMLAVVAEGERERVYLSPTDEAAVIAGSTRPQWRPDLRMPDNPRWFSPPLYGMMTYGELFTERQLVALTSFSGLLKEVGNAIEQDALDAGFMESGNGLEDGGAGAKAYADAIAVYLAFVIDKVADYWSSICTWHASKTLIRNTFGRQAIPMTWDYAEANPFSSSSGNWLAMVDWVHKVLEKIDPPTEGRSIQADAQTQTLSRWKVISTDPPYYDNIGYAILSDYFYVWLRKTLGNVFPSLLGTIETPKGDELVATPYRHGGKDAAERFFLDGMTNAMRSIAAQAHIAFPITIYYAFKQAETRAEEGTVSTGWETFLQAVIQAGLTIEGTWPARTELSNRMIGSVGNVLSSSIVLACRRRRDAAPVVTRRDFINALRDDLPGALRHLQHGNIAPVDLAQASIGPGMAVFTRYSKVLNVDGTAVSVRDALALINQVLDEILAEQEGEFDAETRWAVSWFDEFGFEAADFGIAETLSKAKNTSVYGLVEAGVVESRAGKVRLIEPLELDEEWEPATDSRLTVWEAVHHLVRVLLSSGEEAAAELVARLGATAEVARELAYRLYTIAERKERYEIARWYNNLVQAWPEITRLAAARANRGATLQTGDLFERSGD